MRKSISKALLCICIISSISVGKGSTANAEITKELSDKYISNIKVGFVSMGTISSLNFSLTGDYFILGENIVLTQGDNYSVQYDSGYFKIRKDGQLLATLDRNLAIGDNKNITITPVSNNSLVKFVKGSSTKSFKGNMIFKVSGEGFLPINSLPFEDYVKGVLPMEMGEGFPAEALKAQAVAARTFGLNRKTSGIFSKYGYDVTDNTSCQVYIGYNSNWSQCNLAVDATKGDAVINGGKYIDATFHASNGGYTECSEHVWGGSYPYLVSKPDPFDLCDDNPYKSWSKTISPTVIEGILLQKEPTAKKLISLDTNSITKYVSGRVDTLNILYKDASDQTKTYSLTKDKARTFFNLNGELIKSGLYDVSFDGTNYIFQGKGWGHGVGMSQWGAYGRAERGQDYKQILNFYYENSSIEKILGDKFTTFKTRIGGLNRYETSKKIAENLYPGKIDNVVIATGNNFPDALSGTSLANKLKAPILLVDSTSNSAYSNEALNYIINHLNAAGHIYILGGSGVISDSFINAFKDMGIESANIVRLGGVDRIETSMLIAENFVQVKSTPIVIATQDNFPDALSISAAAAKNGWPILLTDKNNLDYRIEKYISDNKPEKVFIAGGSGVITDNVKGKIKSILGYSDDKVVRFGGVDRYDTGCIINSILCQNSTEVFIATGKDYPDALSGSVYAAAKGATIVLADNSNTQSAERYLKFLAQNSSNIDFTVLGLDGAVSEEVKNYLSNLSK